MRTTIRAVVAATVIAGVTAVSGGSALAATKVCSPGQHGNKAPGFKPAACTIKR